jgi:hypothetical protein
LVVTVFVPLLEELTFRTHLRPKKGNFVLSFIGLLYLNGVLLLVSIHSLDVRSNIIAVLVGVLLLATYFVFQRRIYIVIRRLWRRKSALVFYLTAILFGFYHLQNYTVTLTILILSPIFVLPQIFAGLNLGYLRVRFGFWWGFVLHGLHNAIFLLLPFLLFNSGKREDKLYKNEVVVDYPKNVVAPAKYHLMIENAGEHVYNGSKVGRNGIDFTHATIRHVFESLSGIHSHHVIFEDNTIANRVINLHFADEAQETMEDFTMAKRFVVQQLLTKYNIKAQLCFIPAGNWVLCRSQFMKATKDLSEINEEGEVFERMVLKDATIRDLANKIESVYQVSINCLVDSREKHSFIIPKADITSLQKMLSKEYGLELEKVEIKTTKFYISSRKK